MLEHILVAYDGSDPAERALAATARMALGVGAHVTVFHTHLTGPIPTQLLEMVPEDKRVTTADTYITTAAGYAGVYRDFGTTYAEEIEALGEKLLERAGSTLRELGLDDFDAVARGGDPADAILTYAASNAVDTIAIGSRGHGQLGRLLLGSVSHKVVQGFDGATLTLR